MSKTAWEPAGVHRPSELAADWKVRAPVLLLSVPRASFLDMAQAREHAEVFEGGGVAFDFCAGGDLLE